MPVAPRLAVLPVLAALLGACDAEPGLPEAVARPVLANVQITPTRDSLATDAPTATVPLRVEADLEGEGAVEVRVLVRYAETDSLAAEARTEAASGRVQIDVPLVLPRGATGDYAVTVTTEGADGRPGDRAASVFRFEAASLGPPVVTDVSVPASTARPATGSTNLPIVATVTDPDGRENIAVVVLSIPDVGVLGRLFDAGDGTDEVAGDGRYSAALQIFPDTEAGTFELEAVAVDRAGEQSDPFRFEVTIQ